MDCEKFLEQLPKLYDNWGKASVKPKSDLFQQVLERTGGLTTVNVLQALNFAVSCMENSEIYCEVGCFQGSNLIGALLNNPDKIACAVDNFSEFDPLEDSFQALTHNLSSFNLEERVFLSNCDIHEFLFELRELETEDRIGVYFCNGTRDYRSHLMALLMAKSLLAERAIIFVSYSNWEVVRQANWDFLATHPQCQMVLDFSKEDISESWNGLQIFIWDENKTRNYAWSTFKECKHQSVVDQIEKLTSETKKKNIESFYQEVLKLQVVNSYKRAEKKYRQLLYLDSKNANNWLNFGIFYYQRNQYQKALAVFLKSLEVEKAKAVFYYNLGVVLEKVGELEQAIRAYQNAIALEPKGINAYNNLGNILYNAGDIEGAEAIYRACIAANPEHFGAYLNLGNILMERHRVDEAIENYEKALSLKPRNPDILHNLGVAFDAKNDRAKAALYYGYDYYRRGEYEKAIQYYQEFLQTQTGDRDFYIVLAECYQSVNKYEDAINTYREGIKLYPGDANLYSCWAIALQEYGQVEEAIALLTEASQLAPNNLTLKIQKQFMLPIIYDNEAEIEFYRNEYVQGLENLIQQTSLQTPEERKSALEGVGSRTSFYLQYQGKNDLDLQVRYGQFVHQVMAANYPQWVKPLSMPPLSPNGKIRIGYVSRCMKWHTVGKLMLGWLRNCNHQDFEVFCYYTYRKEDFYTKQFCLYSDIFHHIPDDLEAVCQQILADQLHVLVFIEIGMDPAMTQIAALRLAPVQCTTWGHPITSGLPTIDYFISSELMEPENGKEHYSEQLICLPNIGIAYAKPSLPEVVKTRSEFGLRDDAVLYLSCQSLFKYLPQYDYIFAAIAQRVPQSQFVFLSHQRSEHINEKFKLRLQRAFAEFGLNSKDYCVMLSRLNTPDYLSLNLVSDVFLDTFSWSGGNTTLEAIACNLPVVTCPGEFMRGRHSYGILKMLGVTDTIAKNEAEYIEIAVRLGLDSEWRKSIVEQIASRHSYLYDDKICVEALEEFYRRVVQEARKV
ncbi:MAG: tetratricopeptide repeat protein [Oscillatoriaceae bacterium SKW80]|nr:tetratricopeptide repeat protein [Oscillatoriaceae bacterium SKW80]HIK27431.1 tetratricopeptide repeat protein [Oscillatoriaceae cyanobacterium M7585_C2015_266]